MISATPAVARMASYALADLDTSGFSLAQNESFFPPSPAALRALAEGDTAHALYPDPDWTALRQALASAHGLDPATLLCGAGSMELIAAVVRAFSGPGDSLVASEYSYAFIATACQFAGSTLFSSPENDRTVDVDALLDAVREDTRIVFVANPGNPTGTRIADAELTRLRAQLPDNVLLIIDQAYGEFSESVAPGLWPLVDAVSPRPMRWPVRASDGVRWHLPSRSRCANSSIRTTCPAPASTPPLPPWATPRTCSDWSPAQLTTATNS